MTRKALVCCCALVLGFALAACGAKAPGVALAPEGGATVETAVPSTPSTTSTTPTTTAPTATTPSTGPLSKEPVFTIPKGPPPTHLVKIDLIKGKGTVATAHSTVTVNYVGKLYKNGKVFDASWNRKQPFGPFQLGEGAVIQGWDEGLVGMRVGGRRELIIPPGLAYKKAGSPPSIPPNATLVFVVDLLAVS
jgi:peptidylprolyl isomerase